jgi:hypothetical protein
LRYGATRRTVFDSSLERIYGTNLKKKFVETRVREFSKYEFRACLGELQTAPDPKNNSTPTFSCQTHPAPAVPLRICSKKKVEPGLKSMDLVEYLLRHSTKQNLVELGKITHHCH